MKTTFLRALLCALILVLAQVGFVMVFAPASTDLRARYLKLDNWDSFHYRDLLQNGYHMPEGREVTGSDVHEFRANLGYFPGYLVAGRAVRAIFPHPGDDSILLMTAQLLGVLFWFYLYLLFDLGEVPAARIPRYLLLIAAYPSAMYLVFGYSESTFMAFLVGFIYWCERWWKERDAKKTWAWGFLAALHGFAMVGTRIVGIPVAAYPVVRWVAKARVPRPDGKLFGAGAIMAIALSAAVAFLAYCQFEFGRWDWYFRLQTLGWGGDPNYLAVFNPLTYIPRYFFEDTVNSVSRTAVPFTVWMLWRDLRSDTSEGRRERAALYYAVFVLFYIALAAKADTNLDSMIRYTWPCLALLVLGWAQIKKSTTPAISWGWRVAVVFSLALQGWSAYLFLRGKWVA